MVDLSDLRIAVAALKPLHAPINNGFYVIGENMSEKPVRYKKYWSAPIMCSPEPTLMHYAMAARDMDDCMAGVEVGTEYARHILQWWDDAQRMTIVVACCIVGQLQDSLTSRKDFREVPWPTL